MKCEICNKENPGKWYNLKKIKGEWVTTCLVEDKCGKE